MSTLEEHRGRERQERAKVIAEFDASDSDATLQPMAAEILRLSWTAFG